VTTQSGYRQQLGAAGEDIVARWYEQGGYRVVARNWRCRDGELDLVVRNRTTVVFCEVKTRRSTRFGLPVEAVTLAKQRRIRGLAMRFLREHPQGGGALRFDVAAVMDGKLDVVEGAF